MGANVGANGHGRPRTTTDVHGQPRTSTDTDPWSVGRLRTSADRPRRLRTCFASRKSWVRVPSAPPHNRRSKPSSDSRLDLWPAPEPARGTSGAPENHAQSTALVLLSYCSRTAKALQGHRRGTRPGTGDVPRHPHSDQLVSDAVVIWVLAPCRRRSTIGQLLAIHERSTVRGQTRPLPGLLRQVSTLRV